jgi:NADPH-dependent 2,4-dienoyl-CoA reductase/sulfur reductase-like enzyme
MYKPNKIIVIGGNAAGPSAAAKAKRTNPNADIKLFESGSFISTGTCELPYLLSGEIEDYKKIVFFSPEKFKKEKGVSVFINHIVSEIDTKYKEVKVINRADNNVSEFEYDKIILTTGSRAKEIPGLPFTVENVFSYKSVTDYLKVKNYIDANDVKKILVVGSGYIGLEIADALNTVNFDISILEKYELPMPSADRQVQSLIKELMKNKNIEFMGGSNISRFIIKNNRFCELRYEGRHIEFDMAIVAAGISPNTELAESAGLKLGRLGGIKVDSRLKTSNPDIYAAGDNIEVKNRITNEYDYIPLATHAHNYGHIAGENAAGRNAITEPVLLNSAVKFGGKFIANVGLSEFQAKKYFIHSNSVTAVSNNKVKVMPDSDKVFGKIIFDRVTRNILGASFVGNQEISGYADITAGMMLNKIPADNLAKVNYNYTPPLSPFINILSILGRKILEIN